MATISSIREGIGNRLDSISGLRVHDRWPDKFVPPGAIVHLAPEEGAINYEVVFSNTAMDLQFDLVIAVKLGTYRTAYIEIDEYLSTTGAESIPAAILADQTLGGAVSTCWVRSGGYADIDINGHTYAGAVIRMEVSVA